MRPSRIRAARDRGAAAVEFALVLPVLLLLVLGSIDWGYFFYVQQVVTNAAREGARVGSLTPFDSGDAGVSQSEADAAARTYMTNAGLTGGVGVVAVADQSIDVTVTYETGSVTGFSDLVSILPARAEARAVMRR